MRLSVTSALSVLGLAFTAYLAVGGLIWTVAPAHPVIVIASLALYLAVTWTSILWRQSTSRLPMWAVALILATSIIVPSASWFGAGPDALMQPYATWGMGGVSALLTVLMVRGRPVAAWAGVVGLLASGSAWIGIPAALSLGAVGAIVWVGIAQLVTGLIDRAARDTAQLTTLQQSASEWLASQDGRRRERRVTVQRAIALAGPVLSRVVEARGALDDAEREQARLAEGRLRDELRGRNLLDDEVRAGLDAVRRRGTDVILLDEGGLDGLAEDDRGRIRAEVAAALSSATSERLFIRTSPDERTVVTIVGRSRDEDDPDGDDLVDLWLEIHRP